MKAFRWFVLVAGVLLMIVGMLMMFTPIANLMTMAFFISIAILLSGISEIIHWFHSPKGQRTAWMLMSGLLSTLLGLWIIIGQGTIANIAVILPFMFAFWVMFGGVIRTVGSITMKNQGESRWKWVMASGIIGILYGFLLLNHPLFAAGMLSFMIALLFFYQGINSIIIFFALKRKEN